MDCPADSTALAPVTHAQLEIQQCQQCGGEWLGHDQLATLEAGDDPDPNDRTGMLEYLPNPTDLPCPVCGAHMYEFDYRGNPIELDACEKGHGYWLRAGDESKIRQALLAHAAGLQRASLAEASFGHFLDGLRKKYGGKPHLL